ncbi:IFNA3 protein, partial [Atractosteus spatula]|nr:IFNA3 protein [Atractosteus spatula]
MSFKRYHQKVETAQNVKEVFELASELFKVSPGSVSWDTAKLKEFQELLHTQAAEFAICAPRLKMNNAAWRTKTRVYFEKLKKAVGSEGGEFVHSSVTVPFPSESYRHAKDFKAEEKLVFILEAIKHIRELYSRNAGSGSWDEKMLEFFQLDLHRQTSELERCTQEMKRASRHTKESKKLKRHFKDVEDLLRSKGGEFVHSSVTVPFPSESYRHAKDFKAEEKLVFILEAIKHIRELYSRNAGSGSWDEKMLEFFQLDLHRQTSELERCTQEMKRASRHTKESKKLKRHFKDVEDLLRSKDRTAAWEAVRAQVSRHLQRLELLAGSIRAMKEEE